MTDAVAAGITMLAQDIHNISTRSGFEGPNAGNIHQKLLLVVSEVCEAQEVLRDGHALEHVWYDETKGDKPEGFHYECADAIIRLLHIIHATGGDAAALIARKVQHNATRPRLHGRTF